MATAPADIAASMKRAPSVLLPDSAKNRSPDLTARLSIAMPRISRAEARESILASALKRSRSFMIFRSGRAAGGCKSAINDQYGLLRWLGCRKNKAVRRRQIEPRFDAQKRRNTGDHGASRRHRVPAGGDEAVGFRERLRLIQHDQQLVSGMVGGQDRGEGGQHLL